MILGPIRLAEEACPRGFPPFKLLLSRGRPMVLKLKPLLRLRQTGTFTFTAPTVTFANSVELVSTSSDAQTTFSLTEGSVSADVLNPLTNATPTDFTANEGQALTSQT